MSKLPGMMLLAFCCSMAFAEEESPERCADLAAYGLLDFWIGEWDVYSGDEKVGDNRIEKILRGCAFMEHWKGTGGSEGKSLFFVDANGNWQQVWVTEWATTPGGVKQKTQVDEASIKGVRFQGELHHPDIGPYLDRTTLTPDGNGDVRQIIEISKDDGDSWEVSFDAIYRRKTG